MDGRRRLVIAFGAFCVLALVILMGISIRTREPVCRGKTLSDWVAAGGQNGWAGYGVETPREAVREIGTNATPYLVRWVEYEPTPLRQRFYTFAYRLHLGKLIRDRQRERAEAAWGGLAALGPRGSAAIPALVRLTKQGNPNQRQRAAYTLGYLGEVALEPLMTLAAGPTNPERLCALVVLGAREQLGTNRVRAVPLLVGCLQETGLVPILAATALGDFGEEPGVVVPALTGALGHTDEGVRAAAARGLGRYGRRARAAAPALADALTDDVMPVREAATNALREIAPEVLEGKEAR
jgi:HEAT repeats